MPHEGYKMTELGELPEDWKVCLAKEVIQLKHGYQFREFDFVSSGVPVIKITELGRNGKLSLKDVDYISYDRIKEFHDNLICKEDVLLTMTGGTLGKTVWVDRDYGTLVQNYRVGNLIPKNGIIIRRFIYYLTISDIIQNQIINKINEAAQPNLGKEDFDNFLIPLPPLPEQHRIAEILSTADETIEHTETLIEKYRNIKKGLMADLLTRGIDEKGRIRSEETHRFKDSPLGKIPEDWEVGKLSDIAQIDMGQSPDGETYNSNGNGKPLINGPVEFGAIHPTPIQWTSKPTKICRPGDVLFCVRGSTTGRMNIADQEYCIGRGIAAIRGILNIGVTSYIKYHLEQKKQDIFSLASGGGSTFPNITSKDLNDLSCLCPSHSEQHNIAEILTIADNRIEKEEAYRDKLLQIKKGLMQDLLTGRVRVKVPQEAVA